MTWLETGAGGSLRATCKSNILGDRCRYAAAAVAENGLIYAPPSSAERVLEIDPWSRLVREVGPNLRGIAEVDNGGAPSMQNFAQSQTKALMALAASAAQPCFA